MLDMLQNIFSASFAYSVFRVTTPILFAALGIMISKKAGVTNIAMEGIMLASALGGVVGSALTQSLLLGLIFAIIIGQIMSGILVYFSLKLKSEIFLTGLMINLLASGATVFVMYLMCNDKGMTTGLSSLVFPKVEIPLIKDIPIIGEIFSNHNILTYVAFISVFVVWFIINKTKFGLHVRAVGENPLSAQSVGINVTKTQIYAILLSGFFGTLGGIYMSMGYVSWFSRDMTAGRGFIAMAAQSLGRSTAPGTLFASLAFGVADALANMLQSLRIPTELVQSIPYLTTILGLILYSVNEKRKAAKGKRLRYSKSQAKEIKGELQ